MLCFVKEDIAFWLIDRIFNDIFPDSYQNPDFSQKEAVFLIEISRSLKAFKDFPLEKHEKTVHSCVELFLRSLYVDVLSFQTTYFIWDYFFSKGNVRNFKKSFIKLNSSLKSKKALSPHLTSFFNILKIIQLSYRMIV